MRPTIRVNGGAESYDAVVVGSGFGGAMSARVLVERGLRVLMIERGDWVARGPHNWADDASLDLTDVATGEPSYRAVAGGNREHVGPYACVGGPSVFYGGVSFRFREADFRPASGLGGDPAARWPLAYDELAPYYSAAETVLDVAGDEHADPTEPPHDGPYPQPAPPLSRASQLIGAAAESLGLRPFPLPLAINYRAPGHRQPCSRCTTCDTFACAIGAKNDLATCVIPELMARGMDLAANTVVTRLVHERDRVVAVEACDKATGARRRIAAGAVVLAGGALGSPHLLLASGLERANGAPHLVGAHLMRHCNAIVFGVFARPPDPAREFHKQLGIHDFYFGDAGARRVAGKLGSIQQLQTPPLGLVRNELPSPLRRPAGPVVRHMTGLLVMAEDESSRANRVAVDWARRDRFGIPQLTIEHRYSARDLAARDVLVGRARQVLRRAGAVATYTHRIKTFSHAVGTVRFGDDPATSVLDRDCRFRGMANLFVVDGSFMPTSAGLNPSLTIAANALRAGEVVAS